MPGLTEIHDDLGGAGVEGVKIGSVVSIQARGREVIDTAQSVHQLPAQEQGTVHCRVQYTIIDHLATRMLGGLVNQPPSNINQMMREGRLYGLQIPGKAGTFALVVQQVIIAHKVPYG